MKVFVAHLIVMGILKKNSLEQYWSRDSILNMPLFGHYMSRNHFQNILWNLHISNPDMTNPPKGEANHDPLFLVRPVVDMMQRNFCTKYRQGKELSLDESMCPFKGRVHFKCYNPKKPKRFHIKLFMVSEPSTGYICGFEVYTGDAPGQSQGNAQDVQTQYSCWTWVIMFILIIITTALTWLICCTRENLMHVAQSGKIESHSL